MTRNDVSIPFGLAQKTSNPTRNCWVRSSITHTSTPIGNRDGKEGAGLAQDFSFQGVTAEELDF